MFSFFLFLYKNISETKVIYSNKILKKVEYFNPKVSNASHDEKRLIVEKQSSWVQNYVLQQ